MGKPAPFTLDQLLAWPGYILIFLLIVFPMVLTVLYVKAALFGVAFLLVGIRAVRRRRVNLSWTALCWTLGLAALSLFFVFRGFWNAAPGAANSAQIYVFWPIVYVLIIVGAGDPRSLLGLQRTLGVSALAVGVQGGVYFLTEVGLITNRGLSDFVSLGWDQQAFGLYDGFARMQFPGLNSLPFLMPFLMASLVCRSEYKVNLSRPWLWIGLFVSMVLTIVSGRRALQLVALISPILIYGLLWFQPAKEKQASMRIAVRAGAVMGVAIIVMMSFLGTAFALNARSVTEVFKESFDFSRGATDLGAQARREQYTALLDGWEDEPLLGAGLGTSARGSTRSELAPWSYELTYLALLFQTGIVGVLAYSSGIGWILWKGVQAIKNGGPLGQMVLPNLVGMAGLLIANGTNPYLQRFDGLWAIFIPLAFVNYYLLVEQEKRVPAVIAPLIKASRQGLRMKSTLGGPSVAGN
jgi:O-Antigen ligase